MLTFFISLGYIAFLFYLYTHPSGDLCPYPNISATPTFKNHLLNFIAGIFGVLCFRIGNDYLIPFLASLMLSPAFLFLCSLAVLFLSIGLGYLIADALTFTCPTHGGKYFFYGYLCLEVIAGFFVYHVPFLSFCLGFTVLFFFAWDNRKHFAKAAKDDLDPDELSEYTIAFASIASQRLIAKYPSEDQDFSRSMIFLNLLAFFTFSIAYVSQQPTFCNFVQDRLESIISNENKDFLQTYVIFYDAFVDIYNSHAKDSSWKSDCFQALSRDCKMFGCSIPSSEFDELFVNFLQTSLKPHPTANISI